MASRNINVLMSLQDYVSDPMRKIGKTTAETEKKMKRAQNGLANFGNRANQTFLGAVKGVAAFGTALAGLAIGGAIAGIKSLADEGMVAAQKQIQAETQLEAVLNNVTSVRERGAGAVQNATNALKAYAGELQNAGVIGDEVTLSGMSQLAMYQMTDDQIKQLSGGMLDIMAKQKGVNATQEDAVAVASAIGKAYAGNTKALETMIGKLSDADRNAIKFADSNERVALIAKLMQNRVGGVNKAMANTAVGKQTQAMNAYGDMLEEFGKKLLPIKADLWGAFGEVLPQIQTALMQVFDMIAGGLKEAMPDIKAFIQFFAAALPGAIRTTMSVISAIVPIAKGLYNTLVMFAPVIAGVVAGFVAFNIVNAVAAAFQTLSTIIMVARNAMLLFNLAMSLNPLGLVIIAIGAVVAAIVLLYQHWDTLKVKALEVWQSIAESFEACINRLKNAWENFKNIISHPIDTVVNMVKRDAPAHATGTSYFAGGMTRVNEGGRGELINLPSGSQIIPHSLSKAAMGGNQNINITLNVQGNVIGNEDFYSMCGNAITERLTAALANM